MWHNMYSNNIFDLLIQVSEKWKPPLHSSFLRLTESSSQLSGFRVPEVEDFIMMQHLPKQNLQDCYRGGGEVEISREVIPYTPYIIPLHFSLPKVEDFILYLLEK